MIHSARLVRELMATVQKIMPTEQPLGFVSDIHGNARALRAVIAELQESQSKQLYAAGDLFLAGNQAAEPREVWQLLSEMHARCIRGLSDTALVSVDAETLNAKNKDDEKRLQEFLRTRTVLGELILERVRRLPLQLRIPMIDGREIMMTHGSPADATVSMTHDMSDDELFACVGDDPADIIVCGGSHVPFERQLDGVTIVNLGSVGDSPEGNTAHFTVITPRLSGALIEQRWVDY